VLVQIDLGNDGTIDQVELIGGYVFPAVADVADAPAQAGAEMVLLDHSLARGNVGWVDLDHLLPPSALPPAEGHAVGEQDQPSDESGDKRGGDPERALRRWLTRGGNPGLTIGGGLIGIPGRHEDLAKAVQRSAKDHRGDWRGAHRMAFHPGDLALVPLYDQIYNKPGRPLVYRVSGFALVEILPAKSGDDHGRGHAGVDADLDCEEAEALIHVRLHARFVP
jgi:hypothetical protein